MKRVWAFLALLTIALGALLIWQLARQRATARGPAGGSGVIEGVEVRVSSRLASRITAIRVDEGDRVAAGQVLVELDCVEPESLLQQAWAQLAAAESAAAAARVNSEAAQWNARAARESIQAAGARLEALQVGHGAARREADRLSALRTAGAVPISNLDRAQDQVLGLERELQGVRANQEAARAQALAAEANSRAARAQAQAVESQVEQARAGVRRAEALAAECRLTAPRSGRVQHRHLLPGETVLPGTVVLTLVDLSETKVTFYLPNAEMSLAAVGKPVTVIADAYPGEMFHGVIQRVSAEAEFTPRNVQTREDRERLVYAVEARVENPGERLRAGMPAEVRIDGTEPDR